MEPIVIWKALSRNLGSTTSTAGVEDPPASGTPTQETQPSATQLPETQLVRLQLRVQRRGGRVSAVLRKPVVTPPAEGAESSNAAPAPSRFAPPKVAYHPNVRCLRGGGGVGKVRDPNWPHPVIVGPMYRVGEGYVCEEKATEEEKAKGPVEPAKRQGPFGDEPVEGFDLRGWAEADIQGLRGANGTLDLRAAILCGVDLTAIQVQLQGAYLGEAQLQGADLYEAQLQGANLRGAQLQGADLIAAQLQGAYLYGAQLQGADLAEAQLQGADLRGAELQGASLFLAQLQGAYLYKAQLQGADLHGADLSILAKGFPLPKWGKTEETKEDKPTILVRANLSVLPKGSKYRYGEEVKVSDAARPTNLTDAKASGADFSEADLSGATLTDAKASGADFSKADLRGATFTAATIKGATLKDAQFTPFRPPERPASGALSGAWRAKALLGSVGRAVVAAADDDDDDDDVDRDGESEEEEEEESPLEAEVEKSLDTFMANLAMRAKTFMGKADELLDLVKERMDTILAPIGGGSGDGDGGDGGEGGGACGSSLGMPGGMPGGGEGGAGEGGSEGEGKLAKLLLEKLEEGNGTQVAFNGIISTEVIHPLLAHLIEVLEDELLSDADSHPDVAAESEEIKEMREELTRMARQMDLPELKTALKEDEWVEPAYVELPSSGGKEEIVAWVVERRKMEEAEAKANDELLRQLLKTYKMQLLSATGKAALMKRLSPIIKNCIRASNVRAAPGQAVDEEQPLKPLVQPVDSVNCLVLQLWPALRASLEAQAHNVSDLILSSALAPIKKAGKSVWRMAGRLDKLEEKLISKSEQLATKFGLVAGKEGKGGLRSRLLKATLMAATQYEVRVVGFKGSLDMVRLAWTCSRAKLTKHENELEYLKEELKSLKDMTTTDQTWRDVTETWQATLALLKSVEVERGVAVLQCIASDEKLLKAVGMAETLYKATGEVPTEVVVRLNDGAGAHIRTHAYKYDKLISQELVRIQRVKDIQWRALTLTGSGFVAAMIGTANLFSRLYFRVLESGEVAESERWLLALLFPVGAVVGLLLLLSCCAGCYYRRLLVHGAGRLQGRLRALWPACGMRSIRKTAPASQRVQVKKAKA